MNLNNSIDQNSDLDLRIWIWDYEKYVININMTKILKEIDLIKISFENIDSVESIAFQSIAKLELSQAGSDSLLRILNNYKIKTLKSGTTFRNQKRYLTHMRNVQVEIRDFETERFYQALEPSFYRKTDSTSKNLHSFLTFLKKIMKINFYDFSEKLLANTD